MMQNMMRKAIFAGGFSGPYLYGSASASNMFKALAAGSDSLDLIVIGDSNTKSSLSGDYGYVSGFSQAGTDKGYLIYGTEIYPTMTKWNVGSAYAVGGYKSGADLADPTGNLASGGTSGAATAYDGWYPRSEFVRFGSYTATPPARDDWAYVASGSYSNNYNAVYLKSTHPINITNTTIYHRVRYGTFASGSGSFTPRTRAYSSGAVYATSSAVSSTGAAYSLSATEYAVPITGTVVDMNSSWSGGGSTGPCAILNHSIYKKAKGFCVHSHGYISGGNSTTISGIITTAATPLALSVSNSPVANLLQETRERQIAAGGTGKVCVLSHSGINGSDTTSTWTTAHLNIWTQYKAQWAALGYPAADLSNLCFVGVQRNSGDTSNGGASLAAVRTAAIAMAVANPDMCVVHMPSIATFAELAGTPNYYQNQSASGDVHLSGGSGSSTDGYKLIAGRIIDRLIA